MVTLDDILHHIAQELNYGNETAPRPSLDAIPAECLPHMRLSITDDVEDSELRYLRRYGQGHTFYFRLRDYEAGEKLAGELCWLISGAELDFEAGASEALSGISPLYLFIHIRRKASVPGLRQAVTDSAASSGSYSEAGRSPIKWGSL